MEVLPCCDHMTIRVSLWANIIPQLYRSTSDCGFVFSQSLMELLQLHYYMMPYSPYIPYMAKHLKVTIISIIFTNILFCLIRYCYNGCVYTVVSL